MIPRCLLLAALLPAAAADISLEARDTIAGLELDPGDTVRFRLRNGQTRRLTLQTARARILESNLRQPRKAQPDGGTLYLIEADFLIDGHPLTLLRYVGAQESFPEPYVVNGLRLWLDFASDALALMTDDHGGNAGCAMSKRVRIALHDARDPIAPFPLRHWLPLKKWALDIAESYNGDDPYMGAYQGAECHAGLDINHPKGSPLFAPVPIHDHFYFNSLAAGHNNNRWRGLARFPNGDTWTLQSHHMVSLSVPEHTPIPAGKPYGAAAGVLPGNNEHSHFVFKTRAPGQPADVMLDPWLLFRQLFEQERDKAAAIRAAIVPRGPARAGQPAQFSSAGSRPGPWAVRPAFHWTFGDGAFSLEPNPTHTYAAPGLYAVTLTLSDGVDRAAVTHLITVDGPPAATPAFTLSSTDESTFAVRAPEALDVYGVPPAHDPHTVRFTSHWKEVDAAPKTVTASAPVAAVRIAYDGPAHWLTAAAESNRILLTPAAGALTPGLYYATVSATSTAGARQDFRVLLDIRQNRTPAEIVVDNAGPGFHASPFFWVGHRFRFWRDKGYDGLYLTNGGRPAPGRFARFTPNLRPGQYEVSFVDESPFHLYPNARFRVTIRHRDGVEDRWVEPARDRRLGTFHFSTGTHGYVEIHAAGATGTVIADAVRFRPVPTK